jgi:thiol-disulfide isomerase/thioredoxin
MKMRNILTFLLFIPFLSLYGQKTKPKTYQERFPNYAYYIELNIPGLVNNDTVMLGFHMENKMLARDTAYFQNSKAVFKGNKRLERGVYFIYLPQDRGYFEILIGGESHFGISTKRKVEQDYVDYTEHLSFLESEENTTHFEYTKSLNPLGMRKMAIDQEIQMLSASPSPESEAKIQELKAESKEIDKKVDSMRKSYAENYPNHLMASIFKLMDGIQIPDSPVNPDGSIDSNFQRNYYINNYWDHINFAEEGLLRTPKGVFKRLLDNYFDRVVSPDPDTIISKIDMLIGKAEGKSDEMEMYLIRSLTNKFQTSKIMCHDGVFSHMAMKYYCTGRATWMVDSLREKVCEEGTKLSHTRCGKKALDLRMADKDSNFHHLYNVKTDYTVLFFWDPTCGHCKKVIPKLLELQGKYPGVFQVYAVGTENKHKEWLEYLDKNPQMNSWINVNHTDRYWPWPINKANYNIIANPVIFLLDDEKKILGKRIDENKLEEYLIVIMMDKGQMDKEEGRKKLQVIRDSYKNDAEEE